MILVSRSLHVVIDCDVIHNLPGDREKDFRGKMSSMLVNSVKKRVISWKFLFSVTNSPYSRPDCCQF